MSTIQIRRGTKAQLDTLLGTTPLLNGELGYTTDTDEVYCGDGTNHHLIGRVFVDIAANIPTAGVAGRLFHATDTDVTSVDDGSAWVDVSSGIASLDDVADGTTYGRVKLDQLSASNNVAILNDDTNSVTAAQARTHLDNLTMHRIINDAGASSTELWSASKIQDEIAIIVSGIDPQESVIAQLNLTSSEPGSPSDGDRYINTATGNTSGTTQAVIINNIYEWDSSLPAGSRWVETTVSEGMHTWDETLDAAYIYNGTAWVKFGSTVTHNNLASLQGGTTDEYYHATAAEYTILQATSGSNTGDKLDSAIDHDSLLNTHNLTTDIDHDTITNNHNLSTDIDHNGLTNTHDLTTDINHNTITNGHNLTTDIDHDQLTNFELGEHFIQGDISIPHSQITGFDEQVRDVVGVLATDTTSIDMTYTDAGNATSTLKADLLLADGGSFV